MVFVFFQSQLALSGLKDIQKMRTKTTATNRIFIRLNESKKRLAILKDLRLGVGLSDFAQLITNQLLYQLSYVGNFAESVGNSSVESLLMSSKLCARQKKDKN